MMVEGEKPPGCSRTAPLKASVDWILPKAPPPQHDPARPVKDFLAALPLMERAMATDNNDDDDVSVPEAARFFGVHQRTIHRWAERISGFGWRPHPSARLRIPRRNLVRGPIPTEGDAG